MYINIHFQTSPVYFHRDKQLSQTVLCFLAQLLSIFIIQKSKNIMLGVVVPYGIITQSSEFGYFCVYVNVHVRQQPQRLVVELVSQQLNPFLARRTLGVHRAIGAYIYFQFKDFLYIYTMSLKITNKRVIDFYKNHENISLEDANVFMVDMFEKMLQRDTSPTLLNDMSKTMLSLQGQMETLTNQASKLQHDTQTNLTLKMMEMKDQYIEQLKMTLTNNMSEKISPILKDQTDTFLQKTTLLWNDLAPKQNDLFKLEWKATMEQINYNPEKIEDFIQAVETKLSHALQETHDKMIRSEIQIENGFKEIRDLTTLNQQNVTALLSKMENSSSKGKLSENILFHILQGLYPSASIECVGTQKETGDVMLTRRDKSALLIENKNWDKNVPQSEVQKFIHDCETQNCSGLFLSQHTGVCNKENFEMDIHDGNVLLYIHNVNYDKEVIKIGIDIIDHFKMNLDKLNANVDVNTIKKEVLESIHKEYNHYRQQKDTLQKMIKDVQGKLLKQVDELKMPNLENYLSMFYSFSGSKFLCPYCGFVSGKKAGLSAHERGCKAKREEIF